MSESIELRALRNMAWEKAKGELRSISRTYYDGYKYKEYNNALEAFISFVEDNGLDE